MWRSWLAHHVRDVGVGRSSRLIPTRGSPKRRTSFCKDIQILGKWRSWLARCVRDAEVGCSSHLFPTKGYQMVPFCRRRRCVSNWVSGRLRAPALGRWACVVDPGAGAGRRMVWEGSGRRLSEHGATGSGAAGGAGGSGGGGKAGR